MAGRTGRSMPGTVFWCGSGGPRIWLNQPNELFRGLFGPGKGHSGSLCVVVTTRSRFRMAVETVQHLIERGAKNVVICLVSDRGELQGPIQKFSLQMSTKLVMLNWIHIVLPSLLHTGHEEFHVYEDSTRLTKPWMLLCWRIARATDAAAPLNRGLR